MVDTPTLISLMVDETKTWNNFLKYAKEVRQYIIDNG